MTTLLSRLKGNRIQEGDRADLLKSSILASSLSLAKCSIAAIDKIIASALEELCRIEGADQAGWFAIREDSSYAHVISFPAGGVISRVAGLNRHELPWCRAWLLRGTAVLIPGLAELPSQAMIDRKYFEGLRLRSLALIPVEAGDLSSGVFALLSMRRACFWSNALADYCPFLGTMFLSAYTRRLTYLEKRIVIPSSRRFPGMHPWAWPSKRPPDGSIER